MKLAYTTGSAIAMITGIGPVAGVPELVGPAGVVAPASDDTRQVLAALGHGLAHVDRLPLAQFVAVGLDEIY